MCGNILLHLGFTDGADAKSVGGPMALELMRVKQTTQRAPNTPPTNPCTYTQKYMYTNAHFA